MDIEVLPYYMLSGETFSASSTAVDAAANYDQIITDADARAIEFARLYLNDTEQVSNNGDYHRVWSDMTVGSGNLSGSTALPDGYAKPYIFARIGVKIVGVEDMLFSPVQKLDL